MTFEWDAYVAEDGCNNYKPNDEGWGRGKRPVINVNYNDANVYAAWLSRKSGKIYHLLSDAEREYVARAGTRTPFWWGSSITPKQANYDGNYTYRGGGSKGEYRLCTLPVDSFDPNPSGLYNVHGNVWEWPEDCVNDINMPGDGRARTTGDCSTRVIRGGSGHSGPQFLRSAIRNWRDADKSLPVGLGDEQRLTQVLLNLVGNAIKFTDAGEVCIAAGTRNGHFAVSVTDTGPGIPLDQQAKQIVEMHGGRIWVVSTPGKRSTFQMDRIPKARPTQHGVENGCPMPERPSEQWRPLGEGRQLSVKPADRQ
jgi:hypothetical protein